MSILDDAIREHLELKRQHGADEAELKRLEDEAFGPPSRPEEPDPFAEAPTEFMATPEVAEEGDAGEARRRINVADLQEAPALPPQEEPRVEVSESVEPQAEAPVAPAEDPAQAAPPAEEEPPAMEHEVIAEAPDADTSDEERHAIAEQPTELFDVEAEMGTEDAPATEAASPSDEEIVEAEAAAPKLAPVEPATEIHASRAEAPAEPEAYEEEEDEEFWSDQRLSDELDQALEAPLTEPEPFEEEEDERGGEQRPPAAADAEEEQPHADYDPDTGHEDVLEDTPDFLEDAPEDDELWFEQRPPKDFDLD
jgi:hypothetical protein